MSYDKFIATYGHLIEASQLENEYEKYQLTMKLFDGFVDTFVKVFK